MIPEEVIERFTGDRHLSIYEHLGAHTRAGSGVEFAVWAPHAQQVSVVGDFNEWDPAADRMQRRDEASGIWEHCVASAGVGARYKYEIAGHDGHVQQKADPYAFHAELRPRSASLVADLDGYAWGDAGWMDERAARQSPAAPISIYEVHLGSWARVPEEGDRWLTYREIAPRLARYVREMGFTHVEVLPLAEHALDESWGYQTLSYYAPTSRFGSPHDFMCFVDTLHQAGVGVILDWVPAHFPRDAHGLGRFDGSPLYEYGDPRRGEQPDWGTYVFDYARPQVASFLIANALFWLRRYHLDGLRIDAVASMLYLDYSREPGAWTPNEYGGREHLEAIAFLRELNGAVAAEVPEALMIAEESTAWPMVSRPAHVGGLGFSQKWNMGWMHDTLRFMSHDPLYRGYHLNDLTFSLLYAYHERFVLPYSHDEVVHLKRSMLEKMPGDDWQQFANLRTLYGYMYGHPGRKLLFMGGEFGQRREWDQARSLDWHLLDAPAHRGLQRWVRDLNALYRTHRALHAADDEEGGFEWIDCADAQNVVVSFIRQTEEQVLLFVCNFTPVSHRGYRIGAPIPGQWEVLLNSDANVYGGSETPIDPRFQTEATAWHGREQSLSLDLPPLSTMVLAGPLRS